MANSDISIERWQSFFNEFNDLYEPQKSVEEIKIPEIDIFKADSFFKEFSDIYKPLYEAGAMMNVWQIAGLKHYEVRNCAVLAWLLDCRETHGQGNFFFQVLVDILGLNEEINTSDCYSVVVEKAFDEVIEGETSNRVDIVINNDKLALFIEAKIWSGEGGRQLGRYKNILENINKDCKKLVFLTTSASKSPDCDIAISWKQVAYGFEKAINEKYGNENSILWIPIVRQFCEHLKTL